MINYNLNNDKLMIIACNRFYYCNSIIEYYIYIIILYYTYFVKKKKYDLLLCARKYKYEKIINIFEDKS